MFALHMALGFVGHANSFIFLIINPCQRHGCILTRFFHFAVIMINLLDRDENFFKKKKNNLWNKSFS